MPSLEEIKIDLQGIAYILKNNNLAVPKYQRSHAWRDQNVTDLFQDIYGAIADGGKEYFLGSIVVSFKTPERPEVVDGQQRLATTTILLSAIRDYFYMHGDKERAMSIHNEFLVKTDLESLEMIPKLQLNQTDHNYFFKRVLTLPDSPDRKVVSQKESHCRLDSAANLAKSFVAKTASLTKEPVARLVQLVKYLLEKAKIIWVRVPDDANAFVIFETLNDRGLPLAISDLLKNYLFYLSGSRLDEVQQWWVSMVSTLEAIDKEEIIITYIRQIWSSLYGSTRERELYKAIKEKITSKQLAIDFAQILNTDSRLYAAMLNTTHDFWNTLGSTAREHMAILNDLGMVQNRPLLLAVLGTFDTSEIQKMLKLLVAMSVRFLIVGGLGSGALETHYCIRAMEVRNKTITSATQILEVMRGIIPTDAEFRRSFETVTVSKNYLARYYLRVLENQVKGNSQPELIPNANDEVITLEHILPETPSAAWGHIDPEIAAANYKRLGNMALLTRAINSDIGNQGFIEKKKFSASSDYILTKSLSTHTQWIIENIEQRQKQLADLAVQAWSLKV